jgi:hypothetical protein
MLIACLAVMVLIALGMTLTLLPGIPRFAFFATSVLVPPAVFVALAYLQNALLLEGGGLVPFVVVLTLFEVFLVLFGLPIALAKLATRIAATSPAVVVVALRGVAIIAAIPYAMVFAKSAGWL